MRWLDSITNSTDMNLSMSSQSISSLQGIVKERGAWRAAIQRVEHGLSTEQRWIMMKKNFSCTYLTSVYLPWWSVGSNLLPILLSFLNSSSYAYFINIFYQSVSLFFFFFTVSFEEQRFLISMKFNYLIFTLYTSWFVIGFLTRGKHLLISRLKSQSAVIMEPQKIKSVIVSIFLHLFAMKLWDRKPWS